MPPQNDFHQQQQQLLSNEKRHEEEHKIEPGHTNTMSKDELTFYTRAGEVVDHNNWGFPGYLTEDQYSVYDEFRTEVFSRSQEFRDTLFSFQDAHELEAYALCRWLRARKFDLEETIQMVEEATECSAEPRKNDFFPSPSLALGCDAGFYIKHYPQVYFGHGRNGCPVFYTKPSEIDINALETITSFSNIIDFHWNGMKHKFSKKLKDQYIASDGSYKRYACVCVLDLKGLSASQLSKRPLRLIKDQSAIDSLCFPETLSHMTIVNAPSFFALTWKLIKSWIDPRTTSKVDVLGTNKDTLLKHLSQFIEVDSLPNDYGGNGRSLDEQLQEDMVCYSEPSMYKGYELRPEKKDTCLIPIRGNATHEIIVEKDTVTKLTVFIRSLNGVMLTIKDESGSTISSLPEGGSHLKHLGYSETDDTELPTQYDLEEKLGVVLEGQGKFSIELDSCSSRYKTVYVLIGTVVFSKHAVTKPQIEEERNSQLDVECSSESSSEYSSESSSECSSECSSVLLSSRSICTGTFAKDEAGEINLMRPTAITRKHKRVFQSAVNEVNVNYDTPSPPQVKRTTRAEEGEENNGIISRLSHLAEGCGNFPTTLSKYLE